MTTDRPVPPLLTLSELLTELGQARAFSEQLVEALDPDQIVWRPHDNSSAIAWHLGHQAAVAHYMTRNLTAAEPPLDTELERLFDSATPEPERGSVPSVEELMDFRKRSAQSVDTTIGRILSGDVGAPEQLDLIASGMVRAIVNHEYQHATWIAEVRAGLTSAPQPSPTSENLITVQGYPVLRP